MTCFIASLRCPTPSPGAVLIRAFTTRTAGPIDDSGDGVGSAIGSRAGSPWDSGCGDFHRGPGESYYGGGASVWQYERDGSLRRAAENPEYVHRLRVSGRVLLVTGRFHGLIYVLDERPEEDVE